MLSFPAYVLFLGAFITKPYPGAPRSNARADDPQRNKNNPNHDQGVADGMRLEPPNGNHVVERDLALASTVIDERETRIRRLPSGPPRFVLIIQAKLDPGADRERVNLTGHILLAERRHYLQHEGESDYLRGPAQIIAPAVHTEKSLSLAQKPARG
jgi:hypothetical protein